MGSATSTATLKFIEQVGKFGRRTLSYQFPLDFELYMLAIELTDSFDSTIEYFSFPVMPNQISKTEPNRVNVKRSMAGVTVLSSEVVAPATISIKGDFGKGFKFLYKKNTNEGSSESHHTGVNINTLITAIREFDPYIKTGFGCIKILQRMIQNATKLDVRGNPNRLYFYNMALGENYLVAVDPNGLTLSQSMDKNMVWQYSINFTVLANVNDLSLMNNGTASSEILKRGAMQDGINSLAGALVSFL